MRRFLWALLFLGVAAFPANAQRIAGAWSGVGLQAEPGHTETWPIELSFNADGSAQIGYPSLQCGGVLTRAARRGGVTFYRERLTYGMERCVNNGTVGLYLQAGRLMWFWTGEHTNAPDMAASAVLNAAAPIS